MPGVWKGAMFLNRGAAEIKPSRSCRNGAADTAQRNRRTRIRTEAGETLGIITHIRLIR